MDKVIIDGIDVSECEFYCSVIDFNKCDCLICKPIKNNIVESVNCERNPNCYFKQLARAKEEIEAYKQSEQEASEIIAEFKEENEKLKIKLMQKSEVDTFFSTPIEGWDNDPCKICRHKQALDEIEKIINEDDFNLCPINDSFDCHRGLEKDILGIINKVKEQ